MLRYVVFALCLATPALAQDVMDQGTAKGHLFGTRGATVSVQPHGFLSDADVATLQAMPQVATLKYYGALAVAPDLGLQAETSTGAFNYHSIDAARQAAMAGCNAKRRSGSPCVVVADILPRRYQAGRPLTLSQDASEAVNGRQFRRTGRDAALAISPSSGAWGLRDGGAAALASCAANGATDCQLVVTR